MPSWVPDAARNYLVHTEVGLSIRAVARANNCHPSTVLRQVRRFEGRRDDPLVDAALRDLSSAVSAKDMISRGNCRDMQIKTIDAQNAKPAKLTQKDIDKEARRVLRRLCEQGATLAVASGMDTSMVVRATAEGEQLQTALVTTEIAKAMALKDWINCPKPQARVARYYITNAGRAALRRLMAEDENRASGFADVAGHTREDAGWDLAAFDGGARAPLRHYAQESPLVGLSRRKDKDGQPFLPRDLVAAGER
ncbi:MAG: DUF6456 domain-containing protein, partial [Pseudomonadota bacterium]